nr:hypothetical protein [uncultured Shimia sp.]
MVLISDISREPAKEFELATFSWVFFTEKHIGRAANECASASIATKNFGCDSACGATEKGLFAKVVTAAR